MLPSFLPPRTNQTPDAKSDNNSGGSANRHALRGPRSYFSTPYSARQASFTSLSSLKTSNFFLLSRVLIVLHFECLFCYPLGHLAAYDGTRMPCPTASRPSSPPRDLPNVHDLRVPKHQLLPIQKPCSASPQGRRALAFQREVAGREMFIVWIETRADRDRGMRPAAACSRLAGAGSGQRGVFDG